MPEIIQNNPIPLLKKISEEQTNNSFLPAEKDNFHTVSYITQESRLWSHCQCASRLCSVTFFESELESLIRFDAYFNVLYCVGLVLEIVKPVDQPPPRPKGIFHTLHNFN